MLCNWEIAAPLFMPPKAAAYDACRKDRHWLWPLTHLTPGEAFRVAKNGIQVTWGGQQGCHPFQEARGLQQQGASQHQAQKASHRLFCKLLNGGQTTNSLKSRTSVSKSSFREDLPFHSHHCSWKVEWKLISRRGNVFYKVPIKDSLKHFTLSLLPCQLCLSKTRNLKEPNLDNAWGEPLICIRQQLVWQCRWQSAFAEQRKLQAKPGWVKIPDEAKYCICS